ncbi:MAG: hydantoinase B/oxoprolinase family protein [Dehalococcoidales bacterium]|nr:hydantoinase B/oxoprolinase family protein [Dehalococcoidales bacterium]
MENRNAKRDEGINELDPQEYGRRIAAYNAETKDLSLKQLVLAKDRCLAEGYYWRQMPIKEERPSDYQVFYAKLLQIAVNAREVLRHVAGSPTVKDSGECMAGIYAPEGFPTALSTGVLLRVYSMSRLVRFMALNDYENDPRITDNDFFFNDIPHYGGQFPEDQFIVLPVFHQAQLVAWVRAVSHETVPRVGDAGGYRSNAASRCHVTMPLALSKMTWDDVVPPNIESAVGRGAEAADIWAMDTEAKMTSCTYMREAIHKLIESYGIDFFSEAMQEIVEDGRRAGLAKVLEQFLPKKCMAGAPIPAAKALADREKLPARPHLWKGPDMARFMKGDVQIVVPGVVPDINTDEYDLIEFCKASAVDFGDPLERNPQLVIRDLANGITAWRTAKELFGVVVRKTGPLLGDVECDMAETSKLRGELRSERRTLAVPAEGYVAVQRERLLKGDIPRVCALMINDMLRFSPEWRDWFKKGWRLPAEFEQIPLSVEDRSVRIEAGIDERRDTANRSQTGQHKCCGTSRAEIPDKILGRLQEHLYVVQEHGRKVISCECGHELGCCETNWKYRALVYGRNFKDIYPGILEQHQDWCLFREFYCPRCLRQLEVEGVPQGVPFLCGTGPDLEG